MKQLSIFYILANNSLGCKQFENEAWSDSIPDGYDYSPNLSNYVAAADSRYLSVGDTTNDNFTWLFYEYPDGGVALLNGSLLESKWIWKESSKEFQASIPETTLRFSAPFTSPNGQNFPFFFASTYANGLYSEETFYTNFEKGNITSGNYCLSR